MRFAAMIFDCDGVLVDSEALAMDVDRERLAAIGLDYERSEFVARFMGLSDAAFAAALDADRRARLGEPLPAGFMDALHAEQSQLLAERLQPIPGAAACARSLGELPKAVASSTSTDLLALKLRVTGLADLFGRHAYSADLVARAKPFPDVFLYAAERLEIAPSQCLVLEDSQNGVRAGLAAGMTVWGFTGGGHADAELGARLTGAGAARVLATFPAVTTALAQS